MKHVIIGTAGHVDHGKTLLVKALTGIDTDRLPGLHHLGRAAKALQGQAQPLRPGVELLAGLAPGGDRGRARPREVYQEHAGRGRRH